MALGENNGKNEKERRNGTLRFYEEACSRFRLMLQMAHAPYDWLTSLAAAKALYKHVGYPKPRRPRLTF